LLPSSFRLILELILEVILEKINKNE